MARRELTAINGEAGWEVAGGGRGEGRAGQTARESNSRRGKLLPPVGGGGGGGGQAIRAIGESTPAPAPSPSWGASWRLRDAKGPLLQGKRVHGRSLARAR